MVGFNRELSAQLTVNRFDDLADRVVEATGRCRDLFFLVAARLGEQADAIVLPEFIRDRCTDVGLVADDDAVAVFFQQFATDSQVADAGRSQLEIEDEATYRDQHMELETEDRHFFGGDFP